MIINGRAISSGKAEGEVVKLDEPFSFLGGVNASTGELNVGKKGNISGKIFIFPQGKGSTVGSFVVYDLLVHGKAPSALINRSAETIVTTGAVISSIPMVDGIDTDIFRDGDIVSVNGDEGTIEIKNVKFVEVVSSAIYSKGKILLLRRPMTARSYPNARSLVAGKIEKDEAPEKAAIREIMEETQIKVGSPDASYPVVHVREGDTLWVVHPFLYRLEDVVPILNKENVGYEWISPEDIGTDDTFVPLTRKVVLGMLGR
jgi:Uncharacterized conserved protein